MKVPMDNWESVSPPPQFGESNQPFLSKFDKVIVIAQSSFKGKSPTGLISISAKANTARIRYKHFFLLICSLKLISKTA